MRMIIVSMYFKYQASQVVLAVKNRPASTGDIGDKGSIFLPGESHR